MQAWVEGFTRYVVLNNLSSPTMRASGNRIIITGTEWIKSIILETLRVTELKKCKVLSAEYPMRYNWTCSAPRNIRMHDKQNWALRMEETRDSVWQRADKKILYHFVEDTGPTGGMSLTVFYSTLVSNYLGKPSAMSGGKFSPPWMLPSRAQSLLKRKKERIRDLPYLNTVLSRNWPISE